MKSASITSSLKTREVVLLKNSAIERMQPGKVDERVDTVTAGSEAIFIDLKPGF
jgi:hypothetical protein